MLDFAPPSSSFADAQSQLYESLRLGSISERGYLVPEFEDDTGYALNTYFSDDASSFGSEPSPSSSQSSSSAIPVTSPSATLPGQLFEPENSPSNYDAPPMLPWNHLSYPHPYQNNSTNNFGHGPEAYENPATPPHTAISAPPASSRRKRKSPSNAARVKPTALKEKRTVQPKPSVKRVTRRANSSKATQSPPQTQQAVGVRRQPQLLVYHRQQTPSFICDIPLEMLEEQTPQLHSHPPGLKPMTVNLRVKIVKRSASDPRDSPPFTLQVQHCSVS